MTTTAAAEAIDEIPPEWRERDARARAELASEQAERDRRSAAELDKVKTTLGIPAEFLAIVDGGSIAPTDPLAELRKGGFGILVLAGAVGRGKSVAASWWVLQSVRDKHKPLFVTAAKLARWERYDNAEMDRILLASRLAIDDLGNEFNDTKGNFLALFDEVIADRVANQRPTVITTNLEPASFVSRYGERVRDRIRGAGRFQVFAGTSLRGTQMGLLPAEDGHR